MFWPLKTWKRFVKVEPRPTRKVWFVYSISAIIQLGVTGALAVLAPLAATNLFIIVYLTIGIIALMWVDVVFRWSTILKDEPWYPPNPGMSPFSLLAVPFSLLIILDRLKTATGDRLYKVMARLTEAGSRIVGIWEGALGRWNHRFKD